MARCFDQNLGTLQARILHKQSNYKCKLTLRSGRYHITSILASGYVGSSSSFFKYTISGKAKVIM